MSERTVSNTHVCPWWGGYFLLTPLRRLIENPETMFRPLVQPGMTVLEPGCGMGYFTLPLARMVGQAGRVIAVDLQQKMLDELARRASRAGVRDRLVIRACGTRTLALDDLAGTVDVTVAMHMVHEVPDPAELMREVFAAVRPGGVLFVCEPPGHVTKSQFASFRAMASDAGFVDGALPAGGRGLRMVLTRPGP